jgi:hypothetical protein
LAWQPRQSGWVKQVPDDFPGYLAEELGTELLVTSSGPTYTDRTFHIDL